VLQHGFLPLSIVFCKDGERKTPRANICPSLVDGEGKVAEILDNPPSFNSGIVIRLVL
jgi:hypothetical protein